MNQYELLFVLQKAFYWIGIAIISFGVIKSVVKLLGFFNSLKSGKCIYSPARMTLCQGIVFGLEFMVAGDIINTMMAPTEKSVLLLGALVLIRTVLSYTLTSELSQLSKTDKDTNCLF